VASWGAHRLTQAAALTEEFQELNSADRPLFIARDQEGGQLLGLTGSTPCAGNIALGAVTTPT
jgi:beta-glucosidase-like glycosyl hydrolase